MSPNRPYYLFMRLGVLDVGSNTVHLLIVDAHPGSPPIPQESFKSELRLTRYLDESGAISETGLEKLLESIKNHFKSAEKLKPDEILAFATSAIRESINSDLVLEAIRNETGIGIEVLSGEDEAKFTFLAARRWLGWSAGDLLVVDIGGGSLEIAVGNEETPRTALSLPLGAGRLTKDFLVGDPFTEKSIQKLTKFVKENIEPIKEKLNGFDKKSGVGTSKTLRTLMKLQSEYFPKFEDGIHIEALDGITNRLCKMTESERAKLPGVSSNRAPQIVAGAIVAQAVMENLRIKSLKECPWALREGIVLRRVDWLNS
jgi:exopolyphosphatase/guanosine-5'-triphosphate,3'-diphosphate pyrophosphatase